MKVRKGFIKRWAYFEVDPNESTINGLVKRLRERGVEVNQHAIENLKILEIKYNDRPLFYTGIERQIDAYVKKIRDHRTDKKIYSRKGRRK